MKLSAIRRTGNACAVLAVLALGPCGPTVAPAADARTPIGFEVTFTREVSAVPISARVYVFLADGLRALGEPRRGPDWFHPSPFFAVETKDWEPGTPLTIDERASGFPYPLGQLPPRRYAAQAVIRLNPDTQKIGDGAGNAYGPTVRTVLDPEAGGLVRLAVDRIVPPRRFRETETIKLVDIPSPLLSAFHHRPIHHRAAVLLPDRDVASKRPALYLIPGFGGDHYLAGLYARDERFGAGKDFVRVLLDPDCGMGHHAFADSPANGPRGRALVEELIAYIEAHFPALAEPRARFLNGHSSGGWSSLWLQVQYPETFGGVWSTSPDPVDFRDFSAIDLYAPGENMFRDQNGERRQIARPGPTPALFLDDFSRMEDVIGDGGQLRSFEAVFSPLGENGKPRRLWDRATGTIDPAVARAWEAHDIRLVLERNWPALGPKLKGKLHVYVGERDTFFLEGAVRLLKASLGRLGSDAQVEIIPGKDHASLLDKPLAARLDREMHAVWDGAGADR